MDEIEFFYTDHDYIPVPRYSVGQTVYVIEDFLGGQHIVLQKLIRVVNPVRWREGAGTMPGHWVVSYRYQDMTFGRPEGRMHTEYTLKEEEIYPTEEEATIALAQQFIKQTKAYASVIASRFRKLGIPMNAAMLQLSAPENQKQE